MDNITTSFSLSDYVDILRRRRAVFFTFFGATVLIVALASFIMKPVYRATAFVLIDVESPHVLTTTVGVNIGPGGGGGDYYAYREYFNSQMEIITSHTIAQQAFTDLDLGRFKKYKKSKTPVEDFIESIEVDPVPETRLLKLNVEDTDPVQAALIANRIAELYIQRNLAYISSTERLNLLKNEYLRLETKHAEFSKMYLEDHPEMMRLQKAIADVAGQMELEKQFPMGKTPSGGAYYARLNYPKANNVSIIDRAKVPENPVRPKKKLNLLIAIVVGLFGGAGLVFFLEYQDAAIMTVEDIEKLTKWPILASIPEMPGSENEFHALDVPNDVATESFRAIITRLFFVNDKQPLKTMAISSFGPQEGKTTTVCNLGIVLAKDKKKVLLVDADLRKPRLNKVFNLKEDKSLESYLSDSSARTNAPQKTDIDNLSLIAGKTPNDNPIALLSSDKMRQFVNKVKGDYDYVIFDTPPMGVISDALILSQVVDGIVVVIESGKTPRKALIRNQKVFLETGIRCAGVILVKAPSSGRESYYYSSKYYAKDS